MVSLDGVERRPVNFMRFTIEVGEKEKWKIEFSRNWFTGAMQTLVDGQPVAQQSSLSPSTHFNLSNKRCYEFSVGRAEPHKVVIETERPWMFGGFRPHKYRVSVDGQMIHEQTGY